MFAWRKKPDRSLASIVEGLRKNRYSDLSSRYGPVSRLEEYAPPDPGDAAEMIERRFGPLFELLGGDDG